MGGAVSYLRVLNRSCMFTRAFIIGIYLIIEVTIELDETYAPYVHYIQYAAINPSRSPRAKFGEKNPGPA